MNFIMMPIPETQFTAVCALLGGYAGTIGAPAPKPAPTPAPTPPVAALTDIAPASAPSASTDASAPAGNGSTATTTASPSDADLGVDAAGHPWSDALHAATKTKTKAGLWRMKVGVERPAAKPGFETPAAPVPASAPAAAPSAGVTAGAAPAPAGEDEDEFAAFTAAAAANGVSAPAARKWTDADLGALCNQAAIKLNDPAPVKAIIAQFAPAGQVPHSRLIPADKREEFAAALEKTAGIVFAG